MAVVVLWVRSHTRADWVQWKRSQLSGPRQYQVINQFFAAEGMLVFIRDVKRGEYEGATEPLFAPTGGPDGVRRDRFEPIALTQNLYDSSFYPHYGFLVETRGFQFSPTDGTWYTVVTLPLWALAALFALMPAARFLSSGVRRLRRNRRTRAGACPGCGYALTANVSGVCPECGTAVR